jgi:hypothetical protein
MGLAYRRNTSADVKVIGPRLGRASRAIVVFPGYIMSGAILGKAFEPYVADDDTLVVINYAERGVNVSEINDKVMAALQTLAPVELRVYGGSMGGMLSKLFLDHYRKAGAPYGASFLFDVSCWYSGGPLSSAIWAAVSEFDAKPPTEHDASQDIVRAARRAGAWVGTPAATSQACFIGKFDPLKTGELLDIANKVVYLRGSSSNDDPLVRTSEAIAGWRVAFPDITVVTLQGRNARWHLPLVEYPRETVSALTATY